MDDLPKKTQPGKGQCDDKVGYGRPPEANRFKSGQSGNPSGRPKGSKNLATLARNHLRSMVTVRENGRERRMSKLDVGITKMINRFAEKGDLRLFCDLNKLLDRPEAETIEIRMPIDFTRLTLQDWVDVLDEQWERVMYRTAIAAGETYPYRPRLTDRFN